jgi:hypothetical protein
MTFAGSAGLVPAWAPTALPANTVKASICASNIFLNLTEFDKFDILLSIFFLPFEQVVIFYMHLRLLIFGTK